MLTSILLYGIILLSIILVSLAAVSAKKRPLLALTISIGYVATLLFFLGAIALNLPVHFDGLSGSVGNYDFGWPLLIDQVSWRLSLFLLVFILNVLIAYKRQNEFPMQNIKQNSTHWVTTPIITLLIFFSLLAVWSDSFFGLANSIVGLLICWSIFLYSIEQRRTELRNVLTSGIYFQLGVGCIGIVTILQPTASMTISETMDWNLSGAILMYLTGLIFVIAGPIQLWRSISKFPGGSTSLVAILPLAPATIGCLIIARISIYQFQSSAYPLLFTLIGLSCLLTGISLAWLHIKNIGKLFTALIIAESGLVLMVAVWSTQMATVAQSGVLILATGAIVLFIRTPPWRFNWPRIVPVLAVVGFPFTAGFSGLGTLYSSWLEGGGLTLFVVTVLLSMLLITLVLHFIKKAEPVNRTEKSDRFLRGVETGSLVLIALALIAVPSDVSLETATIPVIGIFFSTAGAVLLSTFVTSRRLSGNEFRNAFHFQFQTGPIIEFRRRLFRSLDQLIFEISKILEGEGGMLWVLLLIVVLWFAST